MRAPTLTLTLTLTPRGWHHPRTRSPPPTLALLLCCVLTLSFDWVRGAATINNRSDSWINPPLVITTRPLGRRGHTALAYSNHYYLFGGVDAADPANVILYNDLWKFPMVNLDQDAATKAWVEVSAKDLQPSGNYGSSLSGKPSGRYGHSMVLINNQFVIFGGYSTACTDYCRDIWVYDIPSNTWTQSFSHTALITSANVNDGSLYNHFTITEYADVSGEFCDTFATAAAVSCTASHLGPLKRWHHSAVEWQNTMIIFGGYGTSNEKFHNDMWVWHEVIQAHNLVRYGTPGHWEWDDITNKTSVGALWRASPRIRRHHSAVVVGDYMYVFGGYACCSTSTPSVPEPYYLNDLWRFDLNDRDWTELTPSGNLPTGRHGHTMVNANGILVLYGGYTSPDLVNGVSLTDYLSDVWQYNITSNRWVERTAISTQTVTPRWETAGVLYTDTMQRSAANLDFKYGALNEDPKEQFIYMFGGYDGSSFLDTIQAYDLFACPSGCSSNGECYYNYCLCDSTKTGTECVDEKCHSTDSCTYNFETHQEICVACNANGVCNTQNFTEPTCVCNDGFSGSFCENLYCQQNCSGHGYCDNTTCICDNYYTTYPGEANIPKYCLGGNPGVYLSTLEASEKPQHNQCHLYRFQMYNGPTCAQAWCLNNCSSRGRCKHPLCQCMDGFTGLGCQDVDEESSAAANPPSRFVTIVSAFALAAAILVGDVGAVSLPRFPRSMVAAGMRGIASYHTHTSTFLSVMCVAVSLAALSFHLPATTLAFGT